MSYAKLSYDHIQEAYLMKKVVIIIVSAETGFEYYGFNLPFNFIFKPQLSNSSVWHREDKSVDPLTAQSVFQA
jgi:hypothetical protein